MAREPENMVLVVLREIREKQDEHSDRFDRLETRMRHVERQLDDLSKVVCRHGRACPGYPRLAIALDSRLRGNERVGKAVRSAPLVPAKAGTQRSKTWMLGMKPGMTNGEEK